jgi:hypothetical protein
VTRPGQVLFSGFNGDQRFGIPTVDVAQGFSFKLGGNGILPGSRISFQAWNRNTGQVLEFVRGRGLTYTTNGARSNCVVNEEGSHSLSLPPGEYRIQAVYFPGNQPWMSVVDQVVNLNVVPPYVPPPTPNPDVPDVPDIPWWGYGY